MKPAEPIFSTSTLLMGDPAGDSHKADLWLLVVSKIAIWAKAFRGSDTSHGLASH